MKYIPAFPFVPFIRWMLLNFYYSSRFHNYNLKFFESLPDRKWMNEMLLPRLAKMDACRILYVGCAPYTWKSLQVFDSNVKLVTVDYKFRNFIWGGKRHLVADIQKIDKYVMRNSFDIAILNGIFGYGVNSIESQATTYLSLYNVLKPAGILLIGWNTDNIDDPLENSFCKNLYERTNYGGLPTRTTFEGSTHVFDFLKTK